jgi:hypothetical protein
VGALMEVLPFIWVIMIVIQEFHLQSVLYALSEPLILAVRDLRSAGFPVTGS